MMQQYNIRRLGSPHSVVIVQADHHAALKAVQMLLGEAPYVAIVDGNSTIIRYAVDSRGYAKEQSRYMAVIAVE
jgi:hypothetical protein